MTITRPETAFDGAAHVYTDAEGQVLLGVSSVAKIGEAEDSFSIASAWGFRCGYEGAWALMSNGLDPDSPDELRAELQAHGLTPWGTRDKAAKRGNWAHDLLEALATDGTMPTSELLASVDEEHRGHGRGLLSWYLDYRPLFVATEVQVTSVKHGFSGRYDIRCLIEARRLLALAIELESDDLALLLEELDPHAQILCLGDLKTSKRIYPTSHYAQLEGYEGASVEMGFPPTMVRFVINTHPDGTYDVGLSYATYDHFLAYLEALRAIRELKALDPEVRRQKATENTTLALLPALSRDIAGKPGLPTTGAAVGRILGGLRKQGLVRQDDRKVWHLV